MAHVQLNWQSFDGLLSDSDLINVRIDHGVVPPDVVDFRLESSPWLTDWKAIRVPDGLGSAWEIWVEGDRRSDSVALWAHQVFNGQQLEFKKAKLFGVHTGMYDLGGLEQLPGGSRVTFRWVQDTYYELGAWIESLVVTLPRVDGLYRARPGQEFEAQLTVQNMTEYPPWSFDTRIRLGSDAPPDNQIWGPARVDLVGTVEMFQTTTFDFVARAPDIPGDYPFHWGMVQEGVARFGQQAIPTIAVRNVAPVSGEAVVTLPQSPQSWLTFNGQSTDPSISAEFPDPRHARIAWARNDSDSTFYLFHEDRLGARSPAVLLAPRATVTSGLDQLEVEGAWQGQYRGAQASAPPALNLTVGWHTS